MKQPINMLLLSLFLFCNCNKEKIILLEEKTSKLTINETLDGWHKAAANAHFDNYFGVMDSAAIFIGTDASENWSIREFKDFSKPYFDKGKAWDFKAIERNIYLSKDGNFAWFDELLDTWMGTCRGSGVLEKNKSFWKLKHYVLSVAIPNENIQELIAIKKENDSLFITKKQHTRK